jgi:hypothetical protein
MGARWGSVGFCGTIFRTSQNGKQGSFEFNSTPSGTIMSKLKDFVIFGLFCVVFAFVMLYDLTGGL